MALSPAWMAALLQRFGLAAGGACTEIPGGHINDSYVVAVRPEGRADQVLVQRLNPRVFPAGRAVVENAAHVAAHLASEARARGWPEARWRVPEPLRADDGLPGVCDAEGAWWRVFPFLAGTRALERPATAEQVREVGRAFGVFHSLAASYDGPPLHETLPGFHDTPARLAALERSAAAAPSSLAAALAPELAFVRRHADWAEVLLGPTLPRRVVHNDAKAANVLLDQARGTAVAVIDLDTVMPGTLLHDVGDLIRSTVGTTAEDAPAAEAVGLDRDRFAALAGGFVQGLEGTALADEEWRLFVTAGLGITFEQGLRFLTDALQGDRYYRTSRPGQNLDRARVQLRLAAAIAEARPDLEQILRAARH